MSASAIEDAAIRDVIEMYADGMRTTNTELLRQVFHEQAILCGYLGDELIAAPIGALFDWVGANPPPDGYGFSILHVEITNRVAAAKILETDSHGTVIDHFHLLKSEGDWRIVSKIWDGENP